MSREKYPAELVEKVASAIESTMFAEHELPVTGEIHERYLGTAIAALDAIDYTAMREALEAILYDAEASSEWFPDRDCRNRCVIIARAALASSGGT